ncbi:hypothetical protein PSAC2689_20055 [Paraburkholderia sacchari]
MTRDTSVDMMRSSDANGVDGGCGEMAAAGGMPWRRPARDSLDVARAGVGRSVRQGC